MRKIYYLIALFIIFILFMTGYLIYALYSPNFSPAEKKQITVVIKQGIGVNSIAKILYTEGVIKNPGRFKIAAKVLGISTELKAGRYQLNPQNSNLETLKILHKGILSSIRVTIPEGLQSKQIVAILSQKLGLDSLKMMDLVFDSVFTRSFNVPGSSLEGFLFPETYDFFWQQEKKSVLRKMVGHFFDLVDDSLQLKMEEIGFSLLETVTMASLIQGEAIVVEEMTTISAVYYNRIKKRMLLQADPTLQFIIADGPRRLTNKDKLILSPYNTYRYPGLPPGPINNPGLEAIKAAVDPDSVAYLYFVAKGDGTHIFSRTLSEHNRAKRLFDKIRTDVYRNRRQN